MISQEGDCDICPIFFFAPAEDPYNKQKCIEKVCEVNEKITEQGQCEKCVEFTKVTDNKRDC